MSRPSVFECDQCKVRVDETNETSLSVWVVAMLEDGALRMWKWPTSCMCKGAIHLCSPYCRNNYIGSLYGYETKASTR